MVLTLSAKSNQDRSSQYAIVRMDTRGWLNDGIHRGYMRQS